MIILNLLPAEKKHRIALERSRRLQKKLAAVFLSCLVLSTAVLFAANWYVGYDMKSIDQQVAAAQRVLMSRGGDSNTQIEQLNAQITQIQAIQDEHAVWPDIINQLTGTLVNGIALTSASFDATERTFTLTGTAQTRQNLVDFKNQLGAWPMISAIESPLSDLIQRENINFQFRGTFTHSIDQR